MFDLLQDSVWQKTNNLIKEKYGKSLSYRAMKLISEGSEPAEKMFYSIGDDLIIPMKSKNVNLGDVVVDRGSLLDTQQKLEVADLIKFLVEPKLYNIQLKKKEEALNHSGRSLTLVSTKASMLSLYEQEDEKRKTLSQVILLKSHTELSRNRVALKIHEMAERNLFVHLDDIIRSVTSKEELATLSDMTIYIDDVEKLSAKTMELLCSVLETATENGPLFLVGSSLDMDSILKKDWPEALKRDLAGFFFDIDRVPLAQQTSEDILELLFFQFDGVMS
jgi:phosphoenolpyruvate synthase/pyruvate phosphate dikinase